MSNAQTTKDAISAQRKATTALDRVNALEVAVERLARAMKKFFDDTSKQVTQQGEQLAQAVELLDATVKLMGGDAVAKAVDDNRIERATAELERSQKALAAALEKGVVKPSDVITDNCILVAVETKADGTAVPPGRFQYHIDQISEPSRSQLLGNKPGHQIDTPAGTVFKVLEVYEVVPEAPAPAAEPAVAPSKE